MRVCVIGSSGFCGSHLVDALRTSGHWVMGIDIANPISGIDCFRLRSAATLGDECPALLDYVFHCAGPAGPANIKPGYALRQIQGLTQAGLDFAQRCGARFVKFSSSEVYGRSDVTLTEETPCIISPAYDARSEYQIGFIAAEQLCFSHPHPDVQILRLFNVVGPRQRPETGCVLPRFCVQALKGESLAIFGDGRQRRAFMDVSDLTAFCLKLMDKWPEKKGIWNVSNPRNSISIIQLALKFSDIFRVWEGYGDKPYRDSAEKHDISIEKALSLDWSPQVGLDAIVSRTLAWHKEQGQ